MRISCEPKHPDYGPPVMNQRLGVYLYGQRLKNCVFADSDAGIAVVVHTLAPPGTRWWKPTRETLAGEITFRMDPKPCQQ